MPSRILARLIICLTLTYRATLGQLLGGQCRFHPSCSQYMIDAVAQRGPLRGGWAGIKRIFRCHPFGGSGHDPV